MRSTPPHARESDVSNTEQRDVQLVWCCDPPLLAEVVRDVRSGERRGYPAFLGIVKTKPIH
jgi:hypothetical protein